MAKAASGSSVTIAGFTVAEWKKHMDTDEDWTERLEHANDTSVREVVGALDHEDVEVRGLACNMVYAIGIEALGTHAQATVDKLAALAERDSKPKIRNRARVVHEGLAGELERATIRRDLPWLAEYSEAAVPKAVAAIDDARAPVRLQVYLWLANAGAIPADARATLATKLGAQIERETDDVTRRAAEIALAHVKG